MLKYLRQLASESMIYGFAGIMSRFLNILLVPVYTRIFAPEDYGVISLVTTTMAVVSIFVGLALDNSSHRWYWDTEDIEDRKKTLASWAWCQLIVALVFAVGMFGSSDWLGTTIVRQAGSNIYFRLTALGLPLNVMGTVVVNWFRMQRRPWTTMIYSLGINVLTILLTILFVIVFQWGLTGIFTAQVISALVNTLVAIGFMQDWVSPRKFDWQRLKDMLQFALPLIPSALAFWIVNFSDRYFVQIYSTTSEVGLYHVGSSLASIVALLTGAFQQAWGPFALSIHKQLDAKDIYGSVLLGYVWLTAVVGTAITLFATETIRLVATEQYVGASTVVGFLSFSYIAIGLTYIAATGPMIVKTSAPTGIGITMAAAMNIGLNMIFVPYLGKVGSAIATLLSQSVVPFYLFYRSQQMYPIPYRFKTAFGIFASSFFMIWIGTHWQFDDLWIGIIAKLLILSLFIPMLFVLRIMTPAQAKQLIGLSRQQVG